MGGVKRIYWTAYIYYKTYYLSFYSRKWFKIYSILFLIFWFLIFWFLIKRATSEWAHNGELNYYRRKNNKDKYHLIKRTIISCNL